MRIFPSLALALLLLAVPGAATFARDPVTLPADVASAPAESLGTVIGTVGYRSGMSETKVEWAYLEFRAIGASQSGQVRVDRGWFGMDRTWSSIEDGKFKYAAFKMALPEGRYEIIRVVGHYNTTPFNAVCTGGGDTGPCGTTTGGVGIFSVPFEVKRGQTLYLGSFLAHGTLEFVKLGFLPFPSFTEVYFSYADKWERDKAAFAAGDRAVDPAQVDRATLAVNERTGYYLMAEDHVVEPKVRTKDVSSGRASFIGRIAAYRAAHPAPVVETEVHAPGSADQAVPEESPVADPPDDL